MRLRPATPDDLALLERWDAQPHVIESDPHDDWGWAQELSREPSWREQLVAEVDGRPVGFVQIIDPALEETHYWGECAPNLRAIDLWIGEAPDLGRGYGTRMMRLALERCFAEPSVEAVWIDPLESNRRARRFYERMGFSFVEQRRFGADDCAVYALSRSAWRPTEDGVRVLETPRLRLRPWRDADLVPFAALNADPEVMRYLPGVLDRAQSDALAERIRAGFERHGFGLWAVERTDRPTRPFIGFVGLGVPSFEAHFTPTVELGWRLAAEHWGVGLATEGARAALEHAFGELGLPELVSFTAAHNFASRRVMEKLGMTHDARDDFEHPALPEGHPLRRHVLYRLGAYRLAA